MDNTERTSAKQKLLERIAKAESELEHLRGQLRRIESEESNERGAITSYSPKSRHGYLSPSYTSYLDWIDRHSRKPLR